MLNGLKIAATGLNLNNSNKIQPRKADKSEYTPQFASMSNASESSLSELFRRVDNISQEATNKFYKNNLGNLVDPSGRVLFSGMPYNIDVDEDGTIYNHKNPIGKINIYEKENISTQNLMRIRTEMLSLVEKNNITSERLNQRALQDSANGLDLSSSASKNLNLLV